MTQWDEKKRAGQTAFIDNQAVRNFYHQIRTNGHIPLSMDETSLTQHIAYGIYPPSVADREASMPQREAEQDREPER